MDSIKKPVLSGFLKMLALLQDFRTMDWTEVYKYPTVMLQQMRQLVGTDQK